MKRFLLLITITFCSLNVLAQDLYPSNKTISTLEKNLLFNIQKRKLVEQTGTGTDSSKLNIDELFNGSFFPSFTSSGITDSIAITIHDITTSYHTQAGVWIGWSTRSWGPTKFKIQIFNTFNNSSPGVPINTWTTIVDTTGYNKQDYLKKVTGLIPNKVRFTFYTASGTNGRLGISELFLLHPEAVQAYDNLLVKYDKNMNIVLGTALSTADSTRGDLAIYARDAPDNRASLKIGYDASNNLDIYRDRTIPDIYFKANQANTGHMRFVTNNSNFTFNGGKVGIGTTTPTSTLDLRGATGISTMNIRSIAGISSEHAGIVFQDGRSKIGYDGTYSGLVLATSDISKPIIFGNSINAGSGESMRLAGSGNLGIGTNNPLTKLHITLNTITGAAVQTIETIGTGGRPYTLFKAENANYGLIGYESGSSGDVMSIYNYRNAALQFGTNNTSRMIIDGNGNIGVGITPATDKFTVQGSAVFRGASTGAIFAHDNVNGGRTYLALDGNSSNGGIGGGGDYIMLSKYTNGEADIANYGNIVLRTLGVGDLKLSANGYETLFKSNGQVGIGTTNIPTDYKLAVGGNIIAEKIKVKKRVGGVWPDYVFSPDYKLPSLEDVEQFTKKNSHLPEIPSAKEIESDGQDLGEMNRLLLKKIEELTLYMIEQNKEIKALKLKVEQMEKK
ncbi:hypothetical protein [Emticicia agri]|uniref:Peptidase S74 domain-containing protein n=1 Tax=Emticicia agri TaxID=2492393 RepID=A0A4Q5LYY1_9BACT|nr:hypothetical protein [Emticicia agri]RYU94743.1 hypothetical protein EWM59_15535 [Emticicia agri]